MKPFRKTIDDCAINSNSRVQEFNENIKKKIIDDHVFNGIIKEEIITDETDLSNDSELLHLSSGVLPLSLDGCCVQEFNENIKKKIIDDQLFNGIIKKEIIDDQVFNGIIKEEIADKTNYNSDNQLLQNIWINSVKLHATSESVTNSYQATSVSPFQSF
ncbi:uncharacterized protein LOC100572014 isoform X2 [Acyrthosiphon pisum]|uniref:Uncharacterized protein n=1 Tax=Acyrthosiphon pisum TaxID=7029 RepID=A0A8R2NRV3_ACYPI|nr:uncharacterized protein LOC100572014 isoform X2 [Acyrthosiphon pisum]